MATRRLDTRDVRGSSKTRPFRFDVETLAWLTLDEVRVVLKPFGADGEPGRKRKKAVWRA
jgi:hypothetical protein